MQTDFYFTYVIFSHFLVEENILTLGLLWLFFLPALQTCKGLLFTRVKVKSHQKVIINFCHQGLSGIMALLTGSKSFTFCCIVTIISFATTWELLELLLYIFSTLRLEK